MSILAAVSSAVGDRTQAANRAVVQQCLAEPALITEIVGGLQSQVPALQGDCAEVLTQLAEQNPALIAPYATTLVPLLSHPTTRVRWEAMHALALVTPEAPEVLSPGLTLLGTIVRQDTSTIVRDYAVDALSNYAQTSPEAAARVYPFLLEAVHAWQGKHAARALVGLAHCMNVLPEHKPEILALAHDLLAHPRSVVQKAAKKLLR
jgi:hypothetical protein